MQRPTDCPTSLPVAGVFHYGHIVQSLRPPPGAVSPSPASQHESKACIERPQPGSSLESFASPHLRLGVSRSSCLAPAIIARFVHGPFDSNLGALIR